MRGGVVTLPIDVVNEWRVLSGRLQESYAKLERAAERYLEWCANNGVDSIGYLRARAQLEYESERRMPALSRMPSKGLLLEGAWLELLDRYEGRMQNAKFQKEELAKGPVRKEAVLSACTPVHEKQRLLYAGNRNLCAVLHKQTGGFHPLSQQCQLCHEADGCQRALNAAHGFDLVGLRRAKGTIGYPQIT